MDRIYFAVSFKINLNLQKSSPSGKRHNGMILASTPIAFSHVYCIINVNNYKAIQLLQQFEKTHRGHRTQIVNLDELKSKSPTNIGYICVSDLNREE